MNQYFDRMKSLADNQDLQPRIRFMLKDVIDLRHDGWSPRKATVLEGPMPINQIRAPGDDVNSGGGGRGHSGNAGGYGNRRGNRGGDGGDRDNNDRGGNNMSELFRHPMKTRGGLDDMLMGELFFYYTLHCYSR